MNENQCDDGVYGASYKCDSATTPFLFFAFITTATFSVKRNWQNETEEIESVRERENCGKGRSSGGVCVCVHEVMRHVK